MASAVAAVVVQSCVCFCLRSQTLQASALSSSSVTSRKASTTSACVETGAAKTLHEKK